MLDVLLVFYADLQHISLQVGFVDTEENADSMPSLLLSSYPSCVHHIIYPLSLNSVSEQIIVSLRGSHT